MTLDRHRFPLRIDPKLFKKMEKLAENDMRSVNTLICIACKEYVTRAENDGKN